MKLADTILNAGIVDPQLWAKRGFQGEVEVSVQAALHRATIVEATNVYQYCRNRTAALYDLPCGAPPHDIMWVEWMQSNGKRLGALGMVRDGPFRIGLQEPEDVVGENGFRTLRPPKVNLSGKRDAIPMWLSDNMPDQQMWDRVRWVWGVGIFQANRGQAYGPIATIRAALDQWGRLLDVVWALHFAVEESTDLDAHTLHPFSIFLTTMNFMQCANIKLTYVDPPAALSRKHRKKGRLQPGQQLVRYSTLRIQQAGAGTRNRGRPGSGSGDLVAFHPVRGDFHHYGDCCPGLHAPKGLLFGKLTGRFWVPAHVRGNPERGVIKQDFVVGP